MQKKKRHSFRTDLRPPLIVAACIGIALLGVFTAISLIVTPEELPLYGLSLCGIYVLSVGCIL